MQGKQNKVVDCIKGLGVLKYDLRNTWIIDNQFDIEMHLLMIYL